jgi:hypothetical protein
MGVEPYDGKLMLRLQALDGGESDRVIAANQDGQRD